MRHKSLIAAALVAGIAVGGACSSGGGRGDTAGQRVSAVATPAGVIDAASHTAAARTGHVEMTTSTVGNGLEQHVVANGAFDADQHAFSMSVNLAPGASTGTDGAASNAPDDQAAEIIATGDTVYFHVPGAAHVLGANTEWFSTKASQGSSAFEFADPAAFLDFLRGAGGTVDDFGHEDVRGVDTTHLHVAIKLRDALNAATGDQLSRLQRSIDQLGKTADSLIDEEVPADVYIDSSGMVRRLAFDFEVPATASAPANSAKFTIDLFDFGVPVSITAPPADKVTDASATLSQLTGGLTGG